MQSNTLKVAAAIAVATAAACGTASANGFGGVGGFGHGGGVYGFNFGGLYSNLENRIPYFAAFPPVYYSYPVPRTYGHSPFAYPPYAATPELDLAASTPKTIFNPHVKTSAPASADASSSTVSAPAAEGPLVVENPYATPGPRVMHASRSL